MRLNKLLLLTVCAVLSLGAMAQPRIAREVHLGVIGGATMSSYSFTPRRVTQDQARGFTMGVAARYIEEKYFGLQAEFLLTRRGVRDRFDEYPELEFQRNFFYAEVPVLAHIYFNLGKKSEIAVDMGPKFGYYLGDSQTSHLEGDGWQQMLNQSLHLYMHHDMEVSKKFDYGIQAGLGYEFKLNNGMSLQLQGRYYFGLANMFPDKKSDVFETSNNHQIQIVAAVWFRQQIARYMIKRKLKQLNK